MLVINRMVKALNCCVFFPVTLLAAFCIDTVPNTKFVCIGDSVMVFQDINYTSFNSNIIIYKTFANKSEAIVTFSMLNISSRYIIHHKFQDKVSLENGTLLIHNFQSSDEATYVMLYNNIKKRKSVGICELAPPTKRCKPNIIEDGNILTVSLDDHNYCGKPAVSVHWMDHSNNSSNDETIIVLPPGAKAATYRACIKGEALTCVTNSSKLDNCVNYTTKLMRRKDDPAISSDMPLTKTSDFTTVVIVSIVLFIVSLVLLGVIRILIILRRQYKKLSELQPVTAEPEREPSQRTNVNNPLLEENVSDGEQRNEENVNETSM